MAGDREPRNSIREAVGRRAASSVLPRIALIIEAILLGPKIVGQVNFAELPIQSVQSSWGLVLARLVSRYENEHVA